MYGRAHGFSPVDRCELFNKTGQETGKCVPSQNNGHLDLDTYTEAIPLKQLLDLKSTVNYIDENDVDIINTKYDHPKCKYFLNYYFYSSLF